MVRIDPLFDSHKKHTETAGFVQSNHTTVASPISGKPMSICLLAGGIEAHVDLENRVVLPIVKQ